MYILRINQRNINVVKECATVPEIAQVINNELFHGILIAKKSTIYSLLTRPQTLPNIPWKNAIEITRSCDITQHLKI
jgi:hypothetical protein